MPGAATWAALAWGLLTASYAAGLRNMQESRSLTSSSRGHLPPQLTDSRLRILTDLQNGRDSASPEEDRGYDCESLPHMCKAPFHCNTWTHQDTMDIRMRGLATPDQHANLRSWCMPGLEHYAATVVKECVVKHNMGQSAKSTFRRSFVDWSEELDASYCFAEGHCTYAMAANSTLVDMERMCDKRFGGRKGWTKNFLSSLKRLMDMSGVFNSLVSTQDGFKTQRITRVLSKMACAQGIFHCDVEYCKKTFCRDEYYVKKYSKLLPKIRGDEIKDLDVTKEVLMHHKGRQPKNHLTRR